MSDSMPLELLELMSSAKFWESMGLKSKVCDYSKLKGRFKIRFVWLGVY